MTARRISPLIATACLLLPSLANAAYVFTGATITENFDALPTTSTATFFSGTVGVQTAITGTGFVGTKVGGTATTGPNFTADNGSGNGGAIYSYGTTATTERALGMLASGTQIMALGFEVTNSSTLTITEVQISLTAEFWRSSTSAQNVFVAAAGSSDSAGVTSANFLTAAGLTATTTLNGPAFVASNGALDGNNATNQGSYLATITGLDIAPGESFFIRWTDANEAGNDAGLALDNMTVSFTTVVPEPAAALLGALGLLGLLRRRR
ncbi:hypothetical protein [Haloferula sp. BvORR071]|uniref:hypothetical protein n=1 Tax=Haloferula sp. BvORR071 TaxID=1396141 RepID=UPI000556361B|nr:hypothetical protein [Haloferula sp. BvORR071]